MESFQVFLLITINRKKVPQNSYEVTAIFFFTAVGYGLWIHTFPSQYIYTYIYIYVYMYMYILYSPSKYITLPANQHLFHSFDPLNAKLNPICHLQALLGAHYIFHVSRVRVKMNVLQ